MITQIEIKRYVFTSVDRKTLERWLMPSVDVGMENKKSSGAADGSINQYSQPGKHTGLSITIPRGRREILLRIFISQRKVMQVQIMCKIFMKISLVVAEIRNNLRVSQYESE